MSEPIKAGDLVIVVRDCCGVRLGHVFQVHGFIEAGAYHICTECRRNIPSCIAVSAGATSTRLGAAPEWLKRIPPLSELEGNFTATEIEHQKQDFAERVRKMQEVLRG